ncbi:TonB-dependent receptor [uncultured Desulfobulbus sp.]|uniref:TonB-dependent receptor plug domain-containing protein n=1 Tax=uncultured Desulfobulbus sp. TaxID=239745 RepID=UPI0029C952C5|nr:TonB-dependent receptor [uncultured Desulfobulbus sp.]
MKNPTTTLPLRRTLTVLTTQAFLLVQAAMPALADDMADNRFLDMDLTQLMEVTITSVSKKPQTLADTAAAVFVITQEDIRRSGVTSIPEALAMAPGLQVARIGASKWSIASRGFSGYTSNKLLVLIDGRSVYTPAYNGTFWDMQNTLLEDIDRIEVIRGPGATIWGANAVNGVINVITKKAKDTQGTLLRAGAGNQEKLMGAARYGTKIGDSAFARLYVTGNDRGSNELAGSDTDSYDGWQTFQTGFRADGTVGSRNEWSLQGDLFKNDGDQITFPYWLSSSATPIAKYGDYTAGGGNLIGNWQHTFSNSDKLSFKTYYDSNNRREAYYDITMGTLDFDLQYETTLGSRNSLTMGTGYRRVDGEFQDTSQVHIPDQTNDLYSAFFQDEIKLISDSLWLTLGAKYERNDFTGDEWQPSARFLWKPAVDHSFWTAVARAVRTPSMVENGGALTMAMAPTRFPGVFFPVKLYGNPNYDVETLLAYEAGYRWQARRNLSFDLAGYYNDYSDIYGIVLNTNPQQPGLMFSNAQEGYGYGLEFAANWQAKSWLNLAFTYAYQRFELENKDDVLGTSVFQNQSTTKSNPRHQASIRSSVDFAQNWQFNTWLRYVDEIAGRNSVNLGSPLPVDSYFNLDANLIWKPRKDLEIMLAGQNLFNSSQLEYVAELLTPPTEIERSVYMKVTWNF